MTAPFHNLADAARKAAAHKRAFVTSRAHYSAGILERFEREARFLDWLACDCIAAADGCLSLIHI